MFIILGHPRCGTGFTASILQQYSLDIGHEKLGKDGISAWFLACKNDLPSFATYSLNSTREQIDQIDQNDQSKHQIIHCLRDPLYAIPSIYYTETPLSRNSSSCWYSCMKESHEFRMRHLGISNDAPLCDTVVKSFLGWNQLIEDDGVDLQFRIESPQELEKYLENMNYTRNVICEHKTNVNSRPQLKPTTKQVTKSDLEDKLFEWNNVSSELLKELDSWCISHGYEKITERL